MWWQSGPKWVVGLREGPWVRRIWKVEKQRGDGGGYGMFHFFELAGRCKGRPCYGGFLCCFFKSLGCKELGLGKFVA